MPSRNELRAAEKSVKTAFAPDYKSSDAKVKQALAEKLFEGAQNTTGANRFAMLSQSRDISAEHFDLSTTLDAIKTLVESYDMNLADASQPAHKIAYKKLRSLDNAVKLTNFSFEVAKLAREANDYNSAIAAAKNAQSDARKARDKGLGKKASAMLKEFTELKKEYAAFTGAEIALSVLDPKNSRDAGKIKKAYLALGNWTYFELDDLEKGRSYLKMGSDETLRKLTSAEALAKSAVTQYNVGKMWHAEAGKQRSSLQKQRFEGRAKNWYETALEGTKDPLKQQEIKNSLRELEGAGAGLVDLLKMVDPKRDAVAGTWKYEKGNLVSDTTKTARIEI